jgi:hypothetical protein
MKHILLILFLFALNANSQNENVERNFLFYYKNEFRNPKKISIQLIKNSDTTNCKIENGKIIVPKYDTFDVLIRYKNKKSYKIENVDFSKLKQFPNFIVGIENKMNNFNYVPHETPNLYIHQYVQVPFLIEDLKETKSICFLSFKSRNNLNSKKKVSLKSYSKFSKIKNSI